MGPQSPPEERLRADQLQRPRWLAEMTQEQAREYTEGRHVVCRLELWCRCCGKRWTRYASGEELGDWVIETDVELKKRRSQGDPSYRNVMSSLMCLLCDETGRGVAAADWGLPHLASAEHHCLYHQCVKPMEEM